MTWPSGPFTALLPSLLAERLSGSFRASAAFTCYYYFMPCFCNDPPLHQECSAVLNLYQLHSGNSLSLEWHENRWPLVSVITMNTCMVWNYSHHISHPLIYIEIGTGSGQQCLCNQTQWIGIECRIEFRKCWQTSSNLTCICVSFVFRDIWDWMPVVGCWAYLSTQLMISHNFHG